MTVRFFDCCVRLMQWMLLVLGVLAGAAVNAQTDGNAYPQKLVRIVVGFPPGQSGDLHARAFASALQQYWGRPVIVDNLPGANGILAARTVKIAAADGYTLLYGTSGQLAINPFLYKSLPYETLRDFAPVAMGSMGKLYLVANPSLPVNNLRELVAYVKANPGKLNFGSGGTGITGHLAMEMLNAVTGMRMTHVPYKGSSTAITGLIGNDVQLMFEAGAQMLPLIQSGKVKVLAVSTKERDSNLPDLPTVAEQGFPGFDVRPWSALLAPAGTPEAVIEKVNAAMNRASRDPAVLTVVRAGGSETTQESTVQLARFIETEAESWGNAVRQAGIEPE